MNEKKQLITDARSLGIPKMLLLGFQHLFAMFGATILVPILVNGEGYFNSETQVLSVHFMIRPAEPEDLSRMRSIFLTSGMKIKR